MCARHNFPCTRGWMQMVFYYQMIYFLETDITIKHNSCYGCWCSNYYTMHNDTYSVHKRGLVSPMFWGIPLCLSSSTVWCQLPAFSPSWQAGSSGSQDGSHFPRIHTHPLRTVRYNMVKGTLFHKKTYTMNIQTPTMLQNLKKSNLNLNFFK
jgi:hypothetical protein